MSKPLSKQSGRKAGADFAGGTLLRSSLVARPHRFFRSSSLSLLQLLLSFFHFHSKSYNQRALPQK
jgi:hypothetical protein